MKNQKIKIKKNLELKAMLKWWLKWWMTTTVAATSNTDSICIYYTQIVAFQVILDT